MRLCNDASIVNALTGLCSMVEDSSGRDPMACMVLSRIPGDGAPSLLHRVGQAMGLHSLMLRMPRTDSFDPATMDHVVDAATSTDRTILLIVDDAHEGAPGSVREVARIMTQMKHRGTCLLMAVTTTAAERRISAELAEGAELPEKEVAMRRTMNEELRLVRRIAKAMQ